MLENRSDLHFPETFFLCVTFTGKSPMASHDRERAWPEDAKIVCIRVQSANEYSGSTIQTWSQPQHIADDWNI